MELLNILRQNMGLAQREACNISPVGKRVFESKIIHHLHRRVVAFELCQGKKVRIGQLQHRYRTFLDDLTFVKTEPGRRRQVHSEKD